MASSSRRPTGHFRCDFFPPALVWGRSWCCFASVINDNPGTHPPRSELVGKPSFPPPKPGCSSPAPALAASGLSPDPPRPDPLGKAWKQTARRRLRGCEAKQERDFTNPFGNDSAPAPRQRWHPRRAETRRANADIHQTRKKGSF